MFFFGFGLRKGSGTICRSDFGTGTKFLITKFLITEFLTRKVLITKFHFAKFLTTNS